MFFLPVPYTVPVPWEAGRIAPGIPTGIATGIARRWFAFPPSLRISARGALALAKAHSPRFRGFFSYYRMVKTPVVALNKPTEGDRSELVPTLSGSRKVRQHSIVIRQRRRRHLEPSLAPKGHSGLKFVARRECEKVTIN